MNCTYRSARNDQTTRFALKGLALSLMLAFGSSVYALPTGGAVSAGSATIAGAPGTMTINQSSQNVAINWQSFSIGQTEAVRFVQPNSSSVALNRVLGSDPSSILGSLSANGKVFMVNPNGILFGKGAQVNVAGLVASTRNITDGDFMAGNYKFAGSGGGTIVNQGSINADGGYVALLGANVSNEGTIVARLGTVALAAGNAFTLDVAGDGLLNVVVNQGALDALVANGGLIKADGGNVLLTALSAGNLLQSAVNNTGIIQAQTVENRNGTIRLMGDMQSGTVNVGGTLDASAPNGGNGGFIETSAAHVQFASNVNVTTFAPMGLTGTFLIDPADFIIDIGGNIDGTTLGTLLGTNSVVISTVAAPPDTVVAGAPPVTSFNRGAVAPGNGDIHVRDAVVKADTGTTTTLTLNALGTVNIDAAITLTGGNLVVCCGTDINVTAAITTTRGSVLLSAGNDIRINPGGLPGLIMATTNGNVTMCAGRDIIVNARLVVTHTTGIVAAQSLGLARGLVLSAGNAATGPGAAGGTVRILSGPADRIVVTGESPAILLPVNISYNPTSYAVGAETDFSGAGTFTAFTRAELTQFMLVHPVVANGTVNNNAATLLGFKSDSLGNPVPGTVSLAGAGSATFDDPTTAGPNKLVSYSGFNLLQGAIQTGGTGRNFALPTACCGVVTRTTGTITAAPIIPPPGSGTPPILVLPEDSDLLPLPALLPVFYPYTVLAGVDLTVEGIRMPPVAVAPRPVIPPPPVVRPPEAPPVYVPPVLPRRPDRN